MNSITCRRSNTHSGHHVEHNMLLDEISTLFAEALKKLEPIADHPTDSHLEELHKVMAQILLVIPYDK